MCNEGGMRGGEAIAGQAGWEGMEPPTKQLKEPDTHAI
jgi:hypothetical protein